MLLITCNLNSWKHRCLPKQHYVAKLMVNVVPPVFCANSNTFEIITKLIFPIFITNPSI